MTSEYGYRMGVAAGELTPLVHGSLLKFRLCFILHG